MVCITSSIWPCRSLSLSFTSHFYTFFWPLAVFMNVHRVLFSPRHSKRCHCCCTLGVGGALAGLIGHFHSSSHSFCTFASRAILECGCKFSHMFSVYRVERRRSFAPIQMNRRTHCQRSGQWWKYLMLVLMVERWRIHSKKWIELLCVIALTHWREERRRSKKKKSKGESCDGFFTQWQFRINLHSRRYCACCCGCISSFSFHYLFFLNKNLISLLNNVNWKWIIKQSFAQYEKREKINKSGYRWVFRVHFVLLN